MGTDVPALDKAPSTWMIGLTLAGGLALAAITVGVTLSGVDGGNAGLAAAGRASMVLVPVAAGSYAWSRTPHRRFGILLLLAGAGWFLSTLSESDVSLVYSVGRVASWFVELELIYLVLSFPAGRVTGRLDRSIVVAAALLVVLVYLPTAPLDRDFPVPSPYTSCDSGCPDNAFFVLSSEPGAIDSVIRPLRDSLAALLFLVVTLRLAGRVRVSTRLMRKTLNPVLAVAVLRFACAALFLVVRRVNEHGTGVDVVGWCAALGLPAMAAAFLAGLLRWRLFVAQALQSLGLKMRDGRGSATLQSTLADALGDPSLRLFYRVPLGEGTWLDADGVRVAVPEPGTGQLVTTVEGGGGEAIAAIVHDEALRGHDELIEAVAGYARITIDNMRLYAEVEASLAEARDSRARIVASADRERRKIERDLHDGAQQRLVALRIKLELAEEALRQDPKAGLARVQALGAEVEQTLEEIRALAHGVYPPLLSDQGLGEALRAAARRAALPATVSVDGVGRYPPEVESAVYFCCVEALQNAAKHAGDDANVSVSLAEDDRLRFEVRDDGTGFDPVAARDGTGLTNMRDRVSAVGGDLELSAAPGEGAAVIGSVPLGRLS
ncbi:MAG TPA: histidine kinase [Thermoleophilaceae bacterium]|nr:histidine kinase [Thermoleophilaceae bacterium]